MYGIIIGIDPGGNGAICHLKLKNGKPFGTTKVVKMPKEFKDINNYIASITEGLDRSVCFLEKVNMRPQDMHGGKAFGIQKLMKNFNLVEAALSANGVTCIHVVPISWQNGLKLRLKKEEAKKESDKDRKNRYKSFAQSKFKTLKCTLWNSDALLIMYFGLEKLTFDKPWIMKKLPQEDYDLLF